MKFQRSDRVAGSLLKLVSELLTKEVNDPRIGNVTLTSAEVSRDLKTARIYVSPLGAQGEKTKILSGLKSATGFIRLLRDQVVVHEGKLSSLKRFKDDVREVAASYECGLAIEGFQDIKKGDVVEAYERVPVIRRISPAPREREAVQTSAGEKQ